jgi:cobalt-zinc-cadmium efflux system outer membrane protein
VLGGVRRFREAGGDNAFVLGLAVPLPVFDRNQGNILRAGAEVSRAEADAERGRLFLDAALAGAEQRLDQAWRAADGLRRTVLPAAEEAAGFAREGYAAGKFSLLEVLDAQGALSNVREQLNAALLEVRQARADIARLRGRVVDPALPAAARPTP